MVQVSQVPVIVGVLVLISHVGCSGVNTIGSTGGVLSRLYWFEAIAYSKFQALSSARIQIYVQFLVSFAWFIVNDGLEPEKDRRSKESELLQIASGLYDLATDKRFEPHVSPTEKEKSSDITGQTSISSVIFIVGLKSSTSITLITKSLSIKSKLSSETFNLTL